ncbi:MAG: Anaerobic ribonucleoside-triphosphate reductase-activating protein [Candidatus Erwinia impunctatus]|nr:Anaerobic ribonucleoside-triphosphate reductase-activating protein [Culicoides impunctatus]
MYFHQYYPVDIVNGPGTRCTLFVSGCEHYCPGCYNQCTWRVDSGHPFTLQLEEKLISDLNDKRIPRQGLSLSGGDPLHPANVPDILRLVKRVRRECPDKDIWLWTGYQLTGMSDAQREVLACIDVVIDGKFIAALKDPTLLWRGSSNQQIHYLRQPTAQIPLQDD